MDIDNLTLGQIKELQNLSLTDNKQTNIYSRFIGKYVIVRSRNEGINAGFVLDVDDTGVILTQARRLWSHTPKDKSLSWYEGVSVSGLNDNCKISCPVDELAIIEDFSITVCSAIAEKSITEMVSHAQN
jgi:hypothetical protein